MWEGGILDDLVVYCIGDDCFFIVVNVLNCVWVVEELCECCLIFDCLVEDEFDDIVFIVL